MTNPEANNPLAKHNTSSEIEQPGGEKLGLEYFKVAADMIDDVSKLVEVLKTEREADISQHSFMFDTDNLRAVTLPDMAQQAEGYYGPLDEIQIDISSCRGDSLSDMTVRFVFLSPETKEKAILNVSRPANGHDVKHDVITTDTDDEQKKVRPMSQEELNRCIASLCYPSRTGDYSQFDSLNLNDGSIYDTLVDILQKHAKYYSSGVKYNLDATSENYGGYLEYLVDDGDLVSAQLSQIINQSSIEIDGMGELQYSERSTVTEISMIDGVAINFYTEGPFNTLGQRAPLSVDIEDYRKVTKFIQNHIEESHPIQPERMREIAVYDRPMNE